MQDIEKRNLVAQWAFDTRPVLLRFHLWLEDVEVHRQQAEPVSAHTFTPRGIARCIAMTSAATALGTRLFGDFGGGAGKDKQAYNQVKKAADAISALTEIDPADSPAIVTFAGSPPNAAMLSLTHCSAATWSSIP